MKLRYRILSGSATCLLCLFIFARVGLFHMPLFPSAPPENYVVEWEKIADEKHLYWKIECAPFETGDNYKFIGGASYYHPPFDGPLWLEDGATPYWVFSGPTQQDVARQLIFGIWSGHPNIEPQHEPIFVPSPPAPHKECPPPLEGGPVKPPLHM